MFDQIKVKADFPEKIDVIVEIPRGSHSKFEYDEKLGIIKLDRVLHSSVVYPTDYGFIPSTRSEDGDHTDVLLLTSDPLFPGCLVTAKPIGVADMEDEEGKDWKILAVAENDPHYTNVNDVFDVNKNILDEIKNFFEIYKLLENKQVTFTGWLQKDKALKILKLSHQTYLSEHQE